MSGFGTGSFGDGLPFGGPFPVIDVSLARKVLFFSNQGLRWTITFNRPTVPEVVPANEAFEKFITNPPPNVARAYLQTFDGRTVRSYTRSR